MKKVKKNRGYGPWQKCDRKEQGEQEKVKNDQKVMRRRGEEKFDEREQEILYREDQKGGMAST